MQIFTIILWFGSGLAAAGYYWHNTANRRSFMLYPLLAFVVAAGFIGAGVTIGNAQKDPTGRYQQRRRARAARTA